MRAIRIIAQIIATVVTSFILTLAIACERKQVQISPEPNCWNYARHVEKVCLKDKICKQEAKERFGSGKQFVRKLEEMCEAAKITEDEIRCVLKKNKLYDIIQGVCSKGA